MARICFVASFDVCLAEGVLNALFIVGLAVGIALVGVMDGVGFIAALVQLVHELIGDVPVRLLDHVIADGVPPEIAQDHLEDRIDELAVGVAPRFDLSAFSSSSGAFCFTSISSKGCVNW